MEAPKSLTPVQHLVAKLHQGKKASGIKTSALLPCPSKKHITPRKLTWALKMMLSKFGISSSKGPPQFWVPAVSTGGTSSTQFQLVNLLSDDTCLTGQGNSESCITFVSLLGIFFGVCFRPSFSRANGLKHMCQGLNSLYWGWSSHLQ